MEFGLFNDRVFSAKCVLKFDKGIYGSIEVFGWIFLQFSGSIKCEAMKNEKL